jgi:hypothetical protein
MTKRRILLIGIPVAVVAIVGLIMALTREREPEYGGKKLSEWVEEYESESRLAGNPIIADRAIRELGTNAIPYLVAWLRYNPPTWKLKLYLTAEKALNKPVGSWRSWDRKERRAMGAISAFRALGAQAQPAVPELGRMITNPASCAPPAIYALGGMGQAGLPLLIAALNNESAGARPWIADEIALMGTNAGPAVPSLLRCLQDTNEILACHAAEALGHIRADPSVVVPALAKSLKDARTDVRLSGAWALSKFTNEAAIRALQKETH